MNLIGDVVRLVGTRDPTKRGLTGMVVLETANTLLIDSGQRILRVEKSGSVFQVIPTGALLTETELSGRLEGRLGGHRR